MTGSPKLAKKAQAASQAYVNMKLLKMGTQKCCKNCKFLT